MFQIPALFPFWMFWLFDAVRYMAGDLLVCAWEVLVRLQRRRELPPAGDLPLVSVIMAGFNEADTMPRTLASLAEQTYPNMEVIVVDDGSGDGTADRVREFIATIPPEGVRNRRARPEDHTPWCRLVRFERRNGKAAALNMGLLLAHGEYIVYVDADTSFDHDSIYEIVRPMLDDPEVGGVGGNIVAVNYAQTVLTELVAIEYLFSISVGRRVRSMFNVLNVISGAFGAFRADLVRAAGAHTPTSGNDGDLTLKVRRLCKKMVFAHRALCCTKTPASWKPLIKQRRRWDRNLIKNKLRRHRDLIDPRSTEFRISNAFLVLDAVFFNLILGFRWTLSFSLALYYCPEILPKMLMASYGLYLGGTAFQLLIAHWLQPPRGNAGWHQWLYMPLYPVYKWIFRIVRLFSYLEEIARQASYADVFAPAPVSVEAMHFDNSGRMRLRVLLRSLLWPFGRRSPR
jgi:cellulose synthase/poly-beta-1,6-N-acetylglucosamine synthase-like glycosyltransferase